MVAVVLCIALTAIFWGGYPLITRSVGSTGAAGPLILALSSLIPIGAAAFYKGASIPSTGAIIKTSAAGMMMGAGLITFLFILGNPRIEISNSVPIINVSMLLVTVIGGLCFFSESLTAQKAIGIILLIVGIAMLRPTS